jgi:hypothetical protein
LILRRAYGCRGLPWSSWTREGGRRSAGSRGSLREVLETGPGDVGEFEFGFFGGAAGLAPFENVLFAGAGGLHHLVPGAGTPVDKAITETHRAVENDSGLLKREKVFIASVRRREALGPGQMGPICLIRPMGGALSHQRPSILVAALPARAPARGVREGARCTGRDR